METDELGHEGVDDVDDAEGGVEDEVARYNCQRQLHRFQPLTRAPARLQIFFALAWKKSNREKF